MMSDSHLYVGLGYDVGLALVCPEDISRTVIASSMRFRIIVGMASREVPIAFNSRMGPWSDPY